MAKYNAFLMVGSGTEGTTTYTKLIDIKDVPDLHGEIEPVETTTKSDDQRRYEEGLMSNEVKVFNANYDADDYDTCKALEGVETHFAIYLGDDKGEDGKFGFTGKARVRLLGSGVGELSDMQIRIIPTSGVLELS